MAKWEELLATVERVNRKAQGSPYYFERLFRPKMERATFVAMNSKAKQSRRSRIQIQAPDRLKRRLRLASKVLEKSMTEIVIDALERELQEDIRQPAGGKIKPTAAMKAEHDAWIKRNLGLLANNVGPEDWKRDDRVGDMLRKYVPRK